MKKVFYGVFFIASVLLGGCQPSSEHQGYVEGRFTYVSSSFSGVLQQLFAHRGKTVKTGEPLFILEEEPESAEVKQLEGQLDQAKSQKLQSEAALRISILTLDRQQQLLLKKASSKEAVDIAKSNFDQAKANLGAATANITALQGALEKALWSKTKKTVYAPIDSLVFDTYFTIGELVDAGQPVVSLLARENVYVVFYLPETFLGKIKIGQKVQVFCDSCTAPVNAEIGYISAFSEYTPPVIFSRETRDKLVYRIEAYLRAEDAFKLHPGQPVSVKLIDE